MRIIGNKKKRDCNINQFTCVRLIQVQVQVMVRYGKVAHQMCVHRDQVGVQSRWHQVFFAPLHIRADVLLTVRVTYRQDVQPRPPQQVIKCQAKAVVQATKVVYDSSRVEMVKKMLVNDHA